MLRPETRYARGADGAHIAWQVHGAGPLDLVLVHGFVSNLELHWEEPGLAHPLSRLGGFARVASSTSAAPASPTPFRTCRRSRRGWTACGR